MNRRNAIKITGLLGLTAAALPIQLFASLNETTVSGYGYHQFDLGSLKCFVVSDGHILFKPVQPGFAPSTSPVTVKKALHDNYQCEDEVDLAVNLLVVKNGSKIILVDTGCGYAFGPTSGWAVNNLKAAGIKAEEITDIVLTHGHPDHLGGLVAKDGSLVFKSANIYLSRIEHDFWLGTQQDFSKSKLTDAATIGMIKKVARENIIAVRSKLQLFDDSADILNSIKCKIVPGHTPGHTVLTLYSGNDELVHIADSVHSATLVVSHADWGFNGDSDFELAIHSRMKLLEEVSKNRKMVFSYHLPWPGMGHVKKIGESYEWIQQTYAIPDKNN